MRRDERASEPTRRTCSSWANTFHNADFIEETAFVRIETLRFALQCKSLWFQCTCVCTCWFESYSRCVHALEHPHAQSLAYLTCAHVRQPNHCTHTHSLTCAHARALAMFIAKSEHARARARLICRYSQTQQNTPMQARTRTSRLAHLNGQSRGPPDASVCGFVDAITSRSARASTCTSLLLFSCWNCIVCVWGGFQWLQLFFSVNYSSEWPFQFDECGKNTQLVLLEICAWWLTMTSLNVNMRTHTQPA